MATKKISEMTEASDLTGAEVPIIQGGDNKRAAASLFGGSSYSVYTALLNQTGENAPVATIFQNTIGNIVWARASVGLYSGTLAGAFPSGKVQFFTSNAFDPAVTYIAYPTNAPNQVEITVYTFDPIEGMWNATDGSIYNMPIEIRVYP